MTNKDKIKNEVITDGYSGIINTQDVLEILDSAICSNCKYLNAVQASSECVVYQCCNDESPIYTPMDILSTAIDKFGCRYFDSKEDL